jgi:hypothetical protein
VSSVDLSRRALSLGLASLAAACAEPHQQLGAPASPRVELVPPPAAEPRRVCTPVAPPDASARLPGLVVPFDPPPVDVEREGLLARFYDGLLDLAGGTRERHVRVAVFGDSNLTMDFTTGRMRRQLSRIFGEGGHGFVALGKPWSHYRHMDVEHDVVSGWKAYAMTTSPIGDGRYGLGGIAVEALFPGGRTFVSTAKAGSPVGTTVQRFDVYFLKRPKGGRFRVEIDRAARGVVETEASELGLGVASFDVEVGPHRLDVVHEWGPTRVFGAALELARPGVVIDSFGVGSMNTKTMGRHDAAIFRAMFRAREYELAIFLLGANDLFTMDAVPDTMRKLKSWIEEALPSSAILMVAPPDRGFRRSMPETLRVVAQREELARELGVAYWDQFRAMGGQGSMRGFVEQKLAFKDAVHYTEEGGAFVGDRFVDAFLRGVERRRVARGPRCPDA